MRGRSDDGTRAGRAGRRTWPRTWPRPAALLLGAVLAGSPGCSDGDKGQGFFSFARRDAPAVPDARLSAGSGTDRLVLDGETAARVAEFELTRARIDRWLMAQEYLSLLANDDPAVARLIDGGGSDAGVDDPSLAIEQAIERLEQYGPVRDGLARVGTSPAEFVLTGLAMHQAFLASSPSAPEELRRMAAHNLRVMQRHEALFQRGRVLDPQQLAYYDSLGWHYPGDTTMAAGAVYDPWAYDTLTRADTLVDSLPPADTLPPDSVRTDSLPRPPVVPVPRDTVRPPVLPPAPPPPRPPDTTARPPVVPPPPPPAGEDE